MAPTSFLSMPDSLLFLLLPFLSSTRPHDPLLASWYSSLLLALHLFSPFLFAPTPVALQTSLVGTNKERLPPLQMRSAYLWHRELSYTYRQKCCGGSRPRAKTRRMTGRFSQRDESPRKNHATDRFAEIVHKHQIILIIFLVCFWNCAFNTCKSKLKKENDCSDSNDQKQVLILVKLRKNAEDLYGIFL